MKITTNTKVLSSALNTVAKAIATKSTLPALEGVLIKAENDRITLTGYNLEIGITTTIPATVKEEGSVVLSFSLFNSIVKKASKEEIMIETNQKMIATVSSGKSMFEIIGIKSDEFPDLPQFDALQSIKLNADILIEAISTTSYACSDNVQIPIYTGSLFEFDEGKLTVCAIDGYRMAVKEIEAKENTEKTSAVIPKTAQLEIKRLFSDEEVEIILGSRHAVFKQNGTEIFTRLIEGTFLDYKSTIPKEMKTSVTVDVHRLKAAVERCSLLNTQSPLITMTVDSEVNIKANSSLGSASDTITALECIINGEPLRIGFNAQFLSGALSAVNTADKVTLNFKDGLSPAILTVADDESKKEIHLIVPMRISDK